MPTIWHYTHGIAIHGIVKQKAIKRVGFCNTCPLFDYERVVWVSSNSQWEMTVKKTHPDRGKNMTFVELCETLGAYRIGIESTPDFIPFKAYKEKFPQLKLIEKPGKEWGANPREWFVSLHELPQSRWSCIEEFKNNKWITMGRLPSNAWIDAYLLADANEIARTGP
jgi:hypothetical protein